MVEPQPRQSSSIWKERELLIQLGAWEDGLPARLRLFVKFAEARWAKSKTSYLPPAGSISEENAGVEQAGRDDTGKT